MSIVFSQLRAFHAVATHGGFTAASRVLNVGQPTLTIQVKELEESYGVELLIRKPRHTELTEAGAALFEITRGIMTFCDEAHDLLAAHGKATKGHLRVATVGPFHATEIIAAFKRDHPEVQISTLLGNSERTFRHIVDFEADVAILAEVPEDPRVTMIPYRTHRVIVFVNRDHPWFKRKSVRLRELADQPIVLRERGSTTRRAFEATMQAEGISIEPVFEIESREGVWKAVERGLGISVVADFEFVPHPNLRALEISDRTIKTQYSIAHHSGRGHSPIIKAFIDTVRRMKGRDATARGTRRLS
ncbi:MULTISPECIES: LysR substrate-binding domain-containing protein [Bradyrhizobium]|uniref:LysR substrate-binding domain-containing protein n=1 Tax=Bradyrhizobium elkanii TaxID=29448 RepID=UPI002714F13A|nr:LysR substrate-binding domain-containing protein [Bradyrhizobium elkanii]WLA51971.1 LysR substrate-binding domain-containing protein [Bradyrhizobium elkanii]WLB85199.1 LysR substrate-binding domain-containing protein [Bradyrhizobium elkanii]